MLLAQGAHARNTTDGRRQAGKVLVLLGTAPHGHISQHGVLFAAASVPARRLVRRVRRGLGLGKGSPSGGPRLTLAEQPAPAPAVGFPLPPQIETETTETGGVRPVGPSS